MLNQTKPPIPTNSPHSGNPARVSLGVQRYTLTQSMPAGDDLSFSQVARILLWHVPLLFIFRAIPMLATAHSVIILFLGLHYLISEKRPERIVWLLAYISGAEILWRGVEAALVWEYGKYATLLLCVLMILKYRLITRGAVWPVVLVALLIPGVFIMPAFDRQAISYELAGLVTLAVLSFAFKSFEFRKTDLQRVFLAVIAPAISMASLVIFMLLTNEVTFYGRAENELITGQIGANQVSAALSWGAMAAFYYIFLVGKDRFMRNLMLLISLGLLTVSVLTFSRAGLWNALAAIAVSLIFLARERKLFFRAQVVVILVGIVAYFIVYPLLVNVTGGAVLARFSDFNSTGRDRIAQSDYQTFQKNPVWGVGVGQARYYRPNMADRFKNNHTEYTRLLAEHGSLGVIAILLLAGVTLYRMTARKPRLWKGISVGFTFWTLLYLLHSATRMVAPSFAFGLAAARFSDEDEDTNA